MNKEQIKASQEYQYLQFVDFRDLGFWDAKSYAKNSLVSGKYELVKITKLLKKQRSKIEIQNDQIYKQLTVRLYGNGVILRKEEFGKNIKTKNQYIAKSGQLVFSRIDARSGAFGIVPDSLDGAIVTNDFPIYSINNDVALPDYLRLMISSPSFTEICKSKSSGTTGRLRMSEIDFENIKVPQPPISKQQELVAAYNQKTIEAEAKEQKANQLEKSIDEYLIEELGIELPQEETKQNHFLRFVEFKGLSRWDSVFLMPTKSILKSLYSLVNLKGLIVFFLKDENGKSLKIDTSKQYPNDKICYIGMENIEKNTGNTLIREMLGINIKSQTVKVPTGFFIYGKLRPYLNKYWFNDNDDRNIVCSSEFFVFKIQENINQLYFKYFISSSITQLQINHHYTGARMPRISPEIFQKIQIPLPPLPIQNQIADKISSIKQEIKTLRNEAENLRTQAKEEFENEVFEVQNSL